MGKMVTVKPGMTHHRMTFPKSGNPVIEEVPAGTMFEASEAELYAFGDKLIPFAVDATPEAWELAEQRQVDMRRVQGSGKGGRILKSDVEAFLGDGQR